jgi:hypothetical protein
LQAAAPGEFGLRQLEGESPLSQSKSNLLEEIRVVEIHWRLTPMLSSATLL